MPEAVRRDLIAAIDRDVALHGWREGLRGRRRRGGEEEHECGGDEVLVAHDGSPQNTPTAVHACVTRARRRCRRRRDPAPPGSWWRARWQTSRPPASAA